MGKVTIEIPNDAAVRIVAGIRQVIEGLETVAEGVAILSAYDPDKAILEGLRELLAQGNTPTSSYTQP